MLSLNLALSLVSACLAGLSSAAPAALPAAAESCTRESLQKGAAAYLDALNGGPSASSSFLATLTSPDHPKVEYLENDIAFEDISKGILASSPIKIDFNLTIYDTTACATYSEIVSAVDTTHPYVIGTRLSFSPSSSSSTTSASGLQITKIDSIVLDQGDWLFNATASLRYNLQESWTPILPASDRDSRETLKAAADAYIDAWGDSTIKPPFDPKCARLEGGFYITTGCLLNFPQPFDVQTDKPKRRYTIDEELGAVDVFHLFPFLDVSLPRQPGTQANNLLRVEKGKIRWIHENTVCQAKNCGR